MLKTSLFTYQNRLRYRQERVFQNLSIPTSPSPIPRSEAPLCEQSGHGAARGVGLHVPAVAEDVHELRVARVGVPADRQDAVPVLLV